MTAVPLSAGLCSLLTNEHIGKLDVEKISSVNDLVDTDPAVVANCLTTTYAEAQALRTVLLAQCAPPIESGHEMFNRIRRQQFLLPTQIDEVDELLDGGLFSNQVYQVVGPPSSGKSHFCMYTALQAAVRHNLRVLMVDSACSFDAARVEQLLSANFSDNERKLVQRIELIRSGIDSIEDLLSLLRQFLEQKTKRGEANAKRSREDANSDKGAKSSARSDLLCKRQSVRLLIVDSLSVYADARMDALDKRSQFVNTLRQVQTALKSIAATGCVVICTVASRHDRADMLKWRGWTDAAHTRLEFSQVDAAVVHVSIDANALAIPRNSSESRTLKDSSVNVSLAQSSTAKRDSQVASSSHQLSTHERISNATTIQCRLVSSCRQKTGGVCVFHFDESGYF